MAQQTTPTDVPSSTRSADLLFRSPDLSDGGGMWRVARDSRTLDLNSSYTYLLFARDFAATDRKSTRLNSSHVAISYAVFCLKKKIGVCIHTVASADIADPMSGSTVRFASV